MSCSRKPQSPISPTAGHRHQRQGQMRMSWAKSRRLGPWQAELKLCEELKSWMDTTPHGLSKASG